jgi:thioredoxin-like negative regulator of GroEL
MAMKDDAEALIDAVRSAGLIAEENRRFESIQDEGFKEAVRLIEKGDMEGAAAVYRKLLENIPEGDPRSLVYRLSLASVLLQNNDLESAKELLDQMVVLPMTAQNREIIFSAFLMSIDLMEALNQFSLRNVYLRQALGKLGELAKQEEIDPQIRAWAELSAAYLHLCYMDIALVEDSLTEENRKLLPDLWFTLSAYLEEMNGDAEGASEVYEEWLAARPEQAVIIRARLANLKQGRPNITRSKIAKAMDEAAAKLKKVEPAEQVEDPAPSDEHQELEPSAP